MFEKKNKSEAEWVKRIEAIVSPFAETPSPEMRSLIAAVRELAVGMDRCRNASTTSPTQTQRAA